MKKVAFPWPHLSYMRLYSADEAKPLKDLVKLIEKVIETKTLSDLHKRSEIERILMKLVAGEDILNPYERRNQGIEDDQWQAATKNALYLLGLKRMYEKIYKV